MKRNNGRTNFDSQEIKVEARNFNLNYLEHWKFSEDILKSLGPLHPKYQALQRALNVIIGERSILQKHIGTLEQEKSETD